MGVLAPRAAGGPPAIRLDREAAPGAIVRGHAIDPAGKLVSDDQQSLERRCRQEASDPLDRHVVLPQPRRPGLRPGRRYWRQRSGSARLLGIPHRLYPSVVGGLGELDRGAPLPEPVWIVGNHLALELR